MLVASCAEGDITEPRRRAVDAGETFDDDEPMNDAGTEGGVREMPDGAVRVGPDAGAASGPGIAAGVRWMGRVDLTDPDKPRFSWSGTGFMARFSGQGLSVQLKTSGAPLQLKPVVDNEAQPPFVAPPGEGTYVLATGLEPGEHVVEMYRQTEGAQGDSQLLGLTVERGQLLAPPPTSDRSIEIVGDSITCGYGNLGKVEDQDCFATESHYDSYGAITARRLDANLSTIAVSGIGAYRNYSGETKGQMSDLYERARTNAATPLWSFSEQPQLVVINLGTNDIGESKTDPGDAFVTAYVKLLEKVRAKNPSAHILASIGPMLSGTALSQIRGHIERAVATRRDAGDEKISVFTFQTQSAASFACQYHPNADEHARMADQLEAEVRRLLDW